MVVRLKTARDIGTLIRDRRTASGFTQLQLATQCGVSVRWLGDVEAGKSTAAIGLVLRVLDSLGVELNTTAPPSRGGVDLDAVLGAFDQGISGETPGA